MTLITFAIFIAGVLVSLIGRYRIEPDHPTTGQVVRLCGVLLWLSALWRAYWLHI